MNVEDRRARTAAPTAQALAEWAVDVAPTDADLRLARRSLIDTVAVAVAARDHEDAPLARRLGDAGRWAMLAHLIDYDDLHIGSTSHISAVCVPAALAVDGDATAYLAGAGTMARLGLMLGWEHYDAGWHSTCTAGAPAAAVTAAVALGLDAAGVATALALAVPAAGGVREAFGTSAKSLQVGFAVDAGVRAARLSADGATADPAALDAWLALVGGRPAPIEHTPAIPGGLAVKVHPCCYALQRPIVAVRQAVAGRRLSAVDIERVTVRVAQDALRPLIHSHPTTGLQGKFSLEYGVTTAILDGRPGIADFADAAVRRPDAQQLLARVVADPSPGGGGLLAGSLEVEVLLSDGERVVACVDEPPGSPGRPIAEGALRQKVEDCAGTADAPAISAVDWPRAPELLVELLGPRRLA